MKAWPVENWVPCGKLALVAGGAFRPGLLRITSLPVAVQAWRAHPFGAPETGLRTIPVSVGAVVGVRAENGVGFGFVGLAVVGEAPATLILTANMTPTVRTAETTMTIYRRINRSYGPQR